MKKIVYLLILLLVSSCSSEVIVNKKAKKIDTGVNPDQWVKIPAGKFYKGMHNHVVNIDYDYEIMVTDVTNSQFAKFLNEAVKKNVIKIVDDRVIGHYKGERFDGYLHEKKIPEGDYLLMPFGEPGSHISLINDKFVVDEGFENHPVVMVTWIGAMTYAKFYGYRVPTENEWEKAARGTDKRGFPWGDFIDKHIANYQSSSAEIKKVLDVKIPRTTPVGFFNGKKYGDFATMDNKNTYGLYDMGGNVWQWTSNDYRDTHYKYMRGGSFKGYEHELTVWSRNSAGPDYYGIDVGFRCVRDIAKKKKEENK